MNPKYKVNQVVFLEYGDNDIAKAVIQAIKVDDEGLSYNVNVEDEKHWIKEESVFATSTEAKKKILSNWQKEKEIEEKELEKRLEKSVNTHS